MGTISFHLQEEKSAKIGAADVLVMVDSAKSVDENYRVFLALGDEHICLSPSRARKIAKALQEAADHAEERSKGE